MSWIDISYAQTTNIDFVALRNSGVEGVYMKATGSNVDTNGSCYVDSKYRYFLPRVRAAGLRVGHYHFNGYGNPAADARFFVGNIQFQTGDQIGLDCESFDNRSWWGPGSANVFHTIARSAFGIVPDSYMSSSVTKAADWSSTVAMGSKLWVAQYGTNNGAPQGAPDIAHWSTYKMWQFTSLGRLPGYGGYLDVNVTNPSEWASNPSPIVIGDEFDMASLADLQAIVDAAVGKLADDVRRDDRARLFQKTSTGEIVAINWHLPAGTPGRIMYAHDGAGQAARWYDPYEIVGDSPAQAKQMDDFSWETLLRLANGNDSSFSATAPAATELPPEELPAGTAV